MTDIYVQAKDKLNDFIKNDILTYAKNRNYDYGPKNRSNVSHLSKYITHRVINEYDVINLALSEYSLSKIEKYVQEVFWRVYWKGWLEHRPQVWNDYYEYSDNNLNNDDYKKAIEGTTGIVCFDNWVEELVNENYLHNHTRMWFASIWIFTLNLPWQLGANFFMRHLLDGDSASNTLSWRWVAGLQTIGKPYIARAENIKHFTDNRFYPKGQLNEDITLLPKNTPHEKAIDLNFFKENSITEIDNLGIVLNNNDLTLNQEFIDLNINYHTCLFKLKSGNPLINKFENDIFEDIINNNNKIELVETIESLLRWIELKKISSEKNLSLSELISLIDHNKKKSNLSSAIRLYILNHLRKI